MRKSSLLDFDSGRRLGSLLTDLLFILAYNVSPSLRCGVVPKTLSGLSSTIHFREPTLRTLLQ